MSEGAEMTTMKLAELVAALNMRPTLAGENDTYLRLRNPVFLCGFFLLYPVFAITANSNNIRITKFCHCVLFALAARKVQLKRSKDAVSMALVFAMRNVFKVFYSIIRFITIFVVDFQAFRPWSNKCFRNEVGNIPMSRMPESYSQITLWQGAKFSDQPRLSVPNAAKIGGLIEGVIGYGFPSFSHYGPPFHSIIRGI